MQFLDIQKYKSTKIPIPPILYISELLEEHCHIIEILHLYVDQLHMMWSSAQPL